MKIHGNYFYGNKISEYGIKAGYVDYGTLAKAFDSVLCNNITMLFDNFYFEQINGFSEDEEEEEETIFQFFIISENGAEILKEFTNEIVYFCDDLNLYIWGVTHFGTGWDYVLTDIKIESEN